MTGVHLIKKVVFMGNNIEKLASELVEGIDFTKVHEADEDEGQVNFWIPKSKKQKFQELQLTTDKKFGKLIKEVIVRCIDKASKAS